jgi:hypothetical protein
LRAKLAFFFWCHRLPWSRRGAASDPFWRPLGTV